MPGTKHSLYASNILVSGTACYVFDCGRSENSIEVGVAGVWLRKGVVFPNLLFLLTTHDIFVLYAANAGRSVGFLDSSIFLESKFILYPFYRDIPTMAGAITESSPRC